MSSPALPMSNLPKLNVGAVNWTDLTVPDAKRVRDFYAAVVGWTHEALDMDGYDDYCMNRPDDGQTVAGICHARGENTSLPPVWLVYINVANVEASCVQVKALGGDVLTPV